MHRFIYVYIYIQLFISEKEYIYIVVPFEGEKSNEAFEREAEQGRYAQPGEENHNWGINFALQLSNE